MATRMQQRRGTAAQWTSANPILNAGEVGWESDTNKFKIGDGTNHWADLAYFIDEDAVANYVLDTELGELTQDIVNSALVAGTGITKTYNDNANTITVAVDTSVIATKAELAEVSQDSINDALTAGTGITKSYDDNANTITLSVTANTYDAYGSASTVAGNLSTHESDTTNIHGIANTAAIVFTTDTGTVTSTMLANETIVNADISNTAAIAWTKIATSASVSETELGYLDGITSNVQAQLDAKATASALSSHESDTSNVHGIANTAVLVTLSGTETITNKSIDLANNTVTGTVAQFNTALSDGNFATLAGSETLTNKTLSSPTITAPGVATLTAVDPQESVPLSLISSTVYGIGEPYLNPIIVNDLTAVNGWSVSAIDEMSMTELAPPNTTVVSIVYNGPAAEYYITLSDTLGQNIALLQDVLLTFTEPAKTISSTEISYLDGVTSAIQTQLNAKAPLASPTFTGNAVFTGNVVAQANFQVDGNFTVNGSNVLVSATQIQIEDSILQLAHENAANTVDLGIVAGYNDGTAKHTGLVRDTSADTWKLFKGVTTEPSTTVDFTEGSLDDLQVAGLTATSLTMGNVTATEFGYLDGVTSAIQTQIDNKISASSTDTLTNKTINLTNNTLSGTLAQFNTALSDADFATIAGSQTLTNKTLSSPTVTGSLTAGGGTGTNGQYLQSTGSGVQWASVSGYSAPTIGSTSIASGATVSQIDGLTLGEPSISIGDPQTFLAVAGTANPALSTNGITWTSTSAPAASSNGWKSVAYGAGKFIAIGGQTITGDVELAVYKSSTGTWTLSTISGSNFDSNPRGIAYGANKFIIMGYNYTAGKGGVQSTDGITWTSWSAPAAVAGYGYFGVISYVQNKFILTDEYSSDVFSSTNGITWTAGTNFFSSGTGAGPWVRPTYGAGKYLIIREGSSGQVRHSTDAITWTAATIGDGSNFGYWTGAAYGNGYFVTSNNYYVEGARSTDGISWTIFSFPVSNGIAGPTIFANGRFIILSNSSYGSADREAYTSTDAITWTMTTLPETDGSNYYDVVYGGTGQSSISSTEISYLDGVTSAIQTQLDSKAVYPSQTGNNGKYLTTNGSTVSWATVSTGVDENMIIMGAL
jgi:hypothetical protein